MVPEPVLWATESFQAILDCDRTNDNSNTAVMQYIPLQSVIKHFKLCETRKKCLNMKPSSKTENTVLFMYASFDFSHIQK